MVHPYFNCSLVLAIQNVHNIIIILVAKNFGCPRRITGQNARYRESPAEIQKSMHISRRERKRNCDPVFSRSINSLFMKYVVLETTFEIEPMAWVQIPLQTPNWLLKYPSYFSIRTVNLSCTGLMYSYTRYYLYLISVLAAVYVEMWRNEL